jgi:hypothetical protein
MLFPFVEASTIAGPSEGLHARVVHPHHGAGDPSLTLAIGHLHRVGGLNLIVATYGDL